MTPPAVFQCKNCGATEPEGAAGDNRYPEACHICRASGPENWIVLADLSDEELAKGFDRHGVTRETVGTYIRAWNFNRPVGRVVARTAEETVGALDIG